MVLMLAVMVEAICNVTGSHLIGIMYMHVTLPERESRQHIMDRGEGEERKREREGGVEREGEGGKGWRGRGEEGG